MIRKILLSLLVIFILAAVVYRLFFAGGMPPGMGGPGGPMPVMVAAPVAVTYQDTHVLTGRLSAVRDAQVRPQVGGMVEKIHFEEGQLVKEGDKLFTLDLRTYAAAAAQGEAQLAQAKAAYERGKVLREQDAISVADLEARKAAYAMARAGATQAAVNLDHAVVKAPISGRVGRPEVTVGNVVGAGNNAPVLTTIQQLDPLYVNFELPEQVYLDIAAAGVEGMAKAPVAVGLANDGDGFPLSATLSAVDNQLGAATGSLRLRATLDNPTGMLVPGLFARVKLMLPEEVQGLAVPDAAVVTDQAGRVVQVMQADKTAKPVPVVLGPLVDGLRVVRGVPASASVVINGLMRVRPGAELLPVPADVRTLQPLTPASQTLTPPAGK